MGNESFAQAWVEVLPDFSEFRTIANAQMTATLGAAGTAGGVAAGKNMNGGILAAIPKIAGPLLAAFAALGIGSFIGETIGNGIRYGLEGIDLASDLAETRGAVEDIFGAAAAGVQKFASTAATQLGQTQQQALDAAKTFGAFGQAAGLSGDELTGFTTDLVTLASDLAAFNNTDVDTAINAIGAALRGESEPIRQYQVLLDDATLKARALEMGIYDGNGALTQQQRVLAAQGEIFAQTGNQQGNFLKTSDQLAGQQKILAASFAEAQTALGESLLPTMLLFTTMANDTLVPILNDVVAKVGPQLADALAQSAPAFVDLVLAIAPLLPDLVELAVTVLPAVLWVMTRLAEDTTTFFAVISGLASWLTGDTSFDDFQQTLNGLSGVFAVVVQAVNNGYMAIVGFDNGVRSVVGSLGSFIGTIPATILGAIGNLGSLLYSSGTALVQGFINGIRAMIGAAGNAIRSVMNYVASFFPHSPAERGPFSGSGWTAVHDAGIAIGAQFESGLKDALPSLDQPMGSLLTGATRSAVRPQAFAAEASRDLRSSEGSFVNKGTIYTVDVQALADEVDKKKRRANAMVGIGSTVIA